MKKKIVIAALAGMLFLSGATVNAAEGGNTQSSADLSGIMDQVKDQLSEAFENVDEETANEWFSFVKEKVTEGGLNTQEGLSQAIEEGEERFGITVDEADARQIVETMEKLEDMGFSAEYVIEKAESLYQEYGAEFVDHADEVVSGAVKNAVSNAIASFFQSIWEAIKSFFENLFSGF